MKLEEKLRITFELVVRNKTPRTDFIIPVSNIRKSEIPIRKLYGRG